MSLIFILLAAIFAASVNFCLRKNLEYQKSAQGYLALYFVFSFIVALIFRMDFDLGSFNLAVSSIGVISGILNLLMMLMTALALRAGPSGLTFAFQNSGSMVPAFLLFILFGTSFGFNLGLPVLIGFSCLALGLFISMRTGPSSQTTHSFGKWIALAIGILLIQGTILSIFQWRSLLLSYPAGSHFLLPWSFSTKEDSWFMPGFFIVPAFVQSIVFFVTERRWFSSKEALLGIIAGILNGGATFCLLMAARENSPAIRPILFPLFAVSVILLCNLWGKYFYQERIHWKGMTLCLAGVFIGSL